MVLRDFGGRCERFCFEKEGHSVWTVSCGNPDPIFSIFTVRRPLTIGSSENEEHQAPKSQYQSELPDCKWHITSRQTTQYFCEPIILIAANKSIERDFHLA